MDRELPAKIIRTKRIKRLSAVAGIAVVVVVGFLGLRAAISPTLDRARVLTSIAEIGPIEATVSASGVVVPEYEQDLTSPIASTIETIHIQSGDSVYAGESIVQLNTEQLQLSYDKVTDELEIQKNKKQQQTLELQRKRADLLASRDIKTLQEKYAQSKYERAKHLFDIGGITKADFDLAALDLEIAKRELQQLTDQVENQKASISATQHELDLQIRVEENRQSEIQRQLDLSSARAGRDGIVTWINDDIGAPVNPGDVVARVADLGSFKIEATISDIHAGKLRLGGPVNVRAGDVTLRGEISSVNPSVQNGILTFMVELNDRSNAVLRPNLRTDVYVVTSTVDLVVRVQNGPFYNGSRNQTVFVVDGQRAVARTVDIGVSNVDWVEIQGDVQPGDVVIVSDMKPYEHMDDIAFGGDE